MNDLKIWSFELTNSRIDFLNYLKDLELPSDNFDFDREYQAIYDDAYQAFGIMEDWEQDYHFLLEKYAAECGEDLLSRLNDEDKDLLNENFGWDGNSWECALIFVGEISIGENYGGPASRDFIKIFSNSNLKRKILELFIGSIIRWLPWENYPELGSKPNKWLNYSI